MRGQNIQALHSNQPNISILLIEFAVPPFRILGCSANHHLRLPRKIRQSAQSVASQLAQLKEAQQQIM